MLPLLLAAALAAEPRLEHHVVHSVAEGRELAWSLYTPPGWDGVTPLPLVVFLHGGGDDERAFDAHPVAWRTLDRWIEDGRLPPFAMVVPRGERGFWRNWHDGSHRWADWVWDEVIPAAHAALPLVPAEDGGLHLIGISMGGAGALQLGLDHLDDVASISVLSAPVPDPERALAFLERGGASPFGDLTRIFGPPDRERIVAGSAYTRLGRPDALGDTRLLLGHGTVDLFGVGPATKALSAHLDAAEVPHAYVAWAGGHRWVDWARVYPVALCVQLGGTGCTEGVRGVRVRPQRARQDPDGSPRTGP